MNIWKHRNKRIIRAAQSLILGTVCLALMPTQTYANDQAAFSLKAFNAGYDVIKSGMTVGDAQFSLTSPSKNVWQYRSDLKATGMARMFVKDEFYELTTIIALGNDIKPVGYRFERMGKSPEKASIKYDWGKKQATYNKDGNSKTVSINKSHQDRYSVILNVMRDAALNRNKTQYTIIEKDIKPYQYTRKGTATMDVKTVGNNETVIHIRQTNNSSREVHYWLSPKLNYTPVRIEQFKDGDSILKMTLKSFNWQ